MATPTLILASTSQYRKQLLERLGVAFTAEAPDVDESVVKQEIKEPAEVVRKLARAKAESVAKRHKGAIVIGCDQVAILDSALLDKPGTAAAAQEQLQKLQGREHFLMTAVAIAHKGGVAEFVDTANLAMRKLSKAEIERYVAADEPLDCAGSYKIESRGIALFERIEASDQSSIMGLPLLKLCEELRKLGVQLP